MGCTRECNKRSITIRTCISVGWGWRAVLGSTNHTNAPKVVGGEKNLTEVRFPREKVDPSPFCQPASYPNQRYCSNDMIMIGPTLEMLVTTISRDPTVTLVVLVLTTTPPKRAEQTHGKHYGQQPGKQIPTHVPTLLNITQHTHNIDPTLLLPFLLLPHISLYLLLIVLLSVSPHLLPTSLTLLTHSITTLLAIP